MQGGYLIMIIAFMLAACSANDPAKNKSVEEENLTYKINTSRQVQKTVTLDHNFRIEVGQSEDFENFKTYTFFILSHRGNKLFIDTSLTEYEFGDTLYPRVITIDNETFQVLVEVNDRPNKNYLKCFRVNHDKIQNIQKLPTFISAAANLDSDNNPEFAGFWDYGEEYGDSGELTSYNPIIYYELTSTGLTLDSSLTIDRNKNIYGKFYGYNYSEKVEIKTNKSKMSNEIKRIEHASKSFTK